MANNIKCCLILFLGLSFFGSSNLSAQVDFEKWKAEQEKEFKEYRDKFDKEFIEMLNKTWKEVGINKEEKQYEEDKPKELPVVKAPPKPLVDNKKPEDEVIEDEINLDFPINKPPKKIDIPKKAIKEKPEVKKESSVETKLFGELPVSSLPLSFFATTIPIDYPLMLKEKLKKENYNRGKINNKRIANFWEIVSSVNHDKFISEVLAKKKQMALNDWGFVLLVNDISKEIFGSYNTNLVRMMNWFILSKAGYEMKIGYDKNGVYNLFTVSNNIFNTKYYTLDNNKFFPINFNAESQKPGSIYTYSGKHNAQVKKLDLSIKDYPTFPSNNLNIKTLEFEFKGKSYKVPVSVNNEFVKYFEYYPLTDLEVFFSAPLPSGIKASIVNSLGPHLERMNEEDAVNFLLKFVQTAFEYQTDQDQFDREKYMFPDEILHYQYSDCDDRSIFFASLVKELLGLDVVGLRYSRHLAVAVNFRNDVSGDYHMVGNKKFTVADPTYINAPFGLTMTSYKNEKPKIIRF
ncbi:MAG: hypothetical protein RJQ00_14090 [Vicingaceae bacterium]|jgi:hypothetical protein